VLVALVATVAIDGQSPLPSASIGVPDRVNEYASIVSDGSWVALAWAATSDSTGTNVYASVSRDGGVSFGRPVRVNAVEKQASINGEQPPRVAFVKAGATPAIVVVWTAKAAAGTLLLSARSTDGGATFGAATPVPGSAAAGNRGWESIAVDASGRVYTVWLDHRDTASQADAGHTMHQHGTASTPTTAGDGASRAQRSQLFVGAVGADLPARGIARGVCYCCKTAAVTAPDGALYLAWRHVYAGNQRDIAFAASRDRGRTFTGPARVSADAWQLDGCPENGPSLAVGKGRVFVLWPTLVKASGGETLRLFLSSTADGTRFSPRIELPAAGAAYHPQLIAAPDGTLIAAWDEAVTGAARRVKLARGRPDEQGQTRFESIDLGPDTDGVYPVLATTPTHAVVAWSARGGTASPLRVRRIPLTGLDRRR
jgi:hypothetical protein